MDLLGDELLTIIILAVTYYIFTSVGGFTDIIQKCLKLQGNMNMVLNVILFIMLVRVLLINTPKYLKMIEYLLKKYMGMRSFKEGQAEKKKAEKNLAESAILKQIKNLEELVAINYQKHDNMEAGKNKDKMLVKIRKWQKEIDDLGRTHATLSSTR